MLDELLDSLVRLDVDPLELLAALGKCRPSNGDDSAAGAVAGRARPGGVRPPTSRKDHPLCGKRFAPNVRRRVIRVREGRRRRRVCCLRVI